MSGGSEEDEINDWMWANILWMNRSLRMEEFAEMPRNVQLAYIASEQLAIECPINSMDRLAKVYIKTKK